MAMTVKAKAHYGVHYGAQQVVLASDIGDIFWDLDPITTYAANIQLGLAIYVANPSAIDRQYALLSRLVDADGRVLLEESIVVHGLAWFTVEAGEYVELQAELLFDITNAVLNVVLVERSTDTEVDTVSAYLVSPVASQLPPGFGGGVGGMDWMPLIMMMLMIPIMGMLSGSEEDKKKRKEKQDAQMAVREAARATAREASREAARAAKEAKALKAVRTIKPKVIRVAKVKPARLPPAPRQPVLKPAKVERPKPLPKLKPVKMIKAKPPVLMLMSPKSDAPTAVKKPVKKEVKLNFGKPDDVIKLNFITPEQLTEQEGYNAW